MPEMAVLKASSNTIIDFYETWMKNKNVITCKLYFEQGGMFCGARCKWEKLSPASAMPIELHKH